MVKHLYEFLIFIIIKNSASNTFILNAFTIFHNICYVW